MAARVFLAASNMIVKAMSLLASALQSRQDLSRLQARRTNTIVYDLIKRIPNVGASTVFTMCLVTFCPSGCRQRIMQSATPAHAQHIMNIPSILLSPRRICVQTKNPAPRFRPVADAKSTAVSSVAVGMPKPLAPTYGG